MAIGKNKMSKGKKHGRHKIVDPMTKKEWYTLKAPAYFQVRDFGLTLGNRTVGTKIGSDNVKSRVFEVSLADLQNGDEDQNSRKIRLLTEEVQGRNCLTDFHGMDMTRDRLCRLVRKSHTLIDGFEDVRTLDGYHLRLFCIAFTDRRPDQVKSTCYAQKSKQKLIRKKMVEIMQKEASSVTLEDLVKKFVGESISREIEQQCRRIFPLKDVFIRKVKVLRRPKMDYTKLMALHRDVGGKADTGTAIPETEFEDGDTKNLLTAEIEG